ncbi:hypothetical protein ABK040_011903 [Willaertia magna]
MSIVFDSYPIDGIKNILQYPPIDNNYLELLANLSALFTVNTQDIVRMSIIIPLRFIFWIIAITFLILCIIFRNRQPLKQRYIYSLLLLTVNIIHSFETIEFIMPIQKWFYTSYYIKGLNPLNIADPLFKPPDLIIYENVICYFCAFFAYTFYIFSVTLYLINLITFILNKLFAAKKVSFVNALQRLKERRRELAKEKIRQSFKPITKKKSTLTTLFGGKSDTELSETNTTSTTSTTNSKVTLDITDQEMIPVDENTIVLGDDNLTIFDDGDETNLDTDLDIDECEDDLDSLNSKRSNLQLLKFLVKNNIIQIITITIITLLWLALACIFIFGVSLPNSGQCDREKRLYLTLIYCLVELLVFICIPLLLTVDFISTLRTYIKTREKSSKTSFLSYYFFETDPFRYRIEALVLSISDTLGSIIAIGFAFSNNEVVSGLLLSLDTSLLIELFGGLLTIPGISLYFTIRDYYLERRSMQPKENNKGDDDIQTLKELSEAGPSKPAIDYVMKHTKERNLFYNYLKQEFSLENLLFLEEVYHFQQVSKNRLLKRYEKCKEIINLFLLSKSDLEINVSRKIVDSVLQQWTKFKQIPNLDTVAKQYAKQQNLNITEEQKEILLELKLFLLNDTLFDSITYETYRNLIDSYYRFIRSKPWQDYLREQGCEPVLLVSKHRLSVFNK